MTGQAVQQPGSVGQRRPRGRLVRGLAWALVGLVVVVACMAVLVALMQLPVSELEQAVASVRRWKWAGVAVQGLVAMAIVMRWPWLAVWCARRGFIPEQEVAFLVAARRKVAVLLGAYWLLVAIGLGELSRLVGSLL